MWKCFNVEIAIVYLDIQLMWIN